MCIGTCTPIHRARFASHRHSSSSTYYRTHKSPTHVPLLHPMTPFWTSLRVSLESVTSLIRDAVYVACNHVRCVLKYALSCISCVLRHISIPCQQMLSLPEISSLLFPYCSTRYRSGQTFGYHSTLPYYAYIHLSIISLSS